MKVRIINLFPFTVPLPSKFTTTKSVQLIRFQHAIPTSWTPQYLLAPQSLALRYLVSILSLCIFEHCTFTSQVFFTVPRSCFSFPHLSCSSASVHIALFTWRALSGEDPSPYPYHVHFSG